MSLSVLLRTLSVRPSQLCVSRAVGGQCKSHCSNHQCRSGCCTHKCTPACTSHRLFSTALPNANRSKTVGFIGLGQMGYGMANNLATKSTDPLLVYDVNQDAVQKFIETHPNARAASSPGDIAEQAATVITMLPESSHVESVYKAMRDAVDKDSILVDSSTIDADVSRRVAADIMSKNATAFDAPVSGGTLGANAGTLTFMVGAPSLESFEKVKPVLCHMGHNVVYCGCNGSGQVAKLCNNMLLGISMIGVSEAMLLGTRLGMDAHLLASILNTSTGRCWSSDTYNPHPGVIPTAPSGKDYKGGFSNKLMAKDLRIAMKAAKDASADPVLGTVAAQIYNQLSVTKDFDSLDFSSVYKWMQTHPETKAVKS